MTSSEAPGQQDAASQAGGNDKRVNSHLRVVFEDACRITASFFDPKQGWGGKSLTIYARQTLREAYPNLMQQDIAILLAAVQRFHRGHFSQ